MDFGIRGKTALVCAASKGLGKGCAMALAREGVNLVITARGKEALEATAHRGFVHDHAAVCLYKDAGEARSRGSSRADSWGSVPMVRIVRLAPTSTKRGRTKR